MQPSPSKNLVFPIMNANPLDSIKTGPQKGNLGLTLIPNLFDQVESSTLSISSLRLITTTSGLWMQAFNSQEIAIETGTATATPIAIVDENATKIWIEIGTETKTEIGTKPSSHPLQLTNKAIHEIVRPSIWKPRTKKWSITPMNEVPNRKSRLSRTSESSFNAWPNATFKVGIVCQSHYWMSVVVGNDALNMTARLSPTKPIQLPRRGSLTSKKFVSVSDESLFVCLVGSQFPNDICMQDPSNIRSTESRFGAFPSPSFFVQAALKCFFSHEICLVVKSSYNETRLEVPSPHQVCSEHRPRTTFLSFHVCISECDLKAICRSGISRHARQRW